MANKLMYIPNDDTQNCPFCKLKLLVETFEHPTFNTNQTKHQSCEAGKYENVIKKLWGLMYKQSNVPSLPVNYLSL